MSKEREVFEGLEQTRNELIRKKQFLEQKLNLAWNLNANLGKLLGLEKELKRRKDDMRWVEEEYSDDNRITTYCFHEVYNTYLESQLKNMEEERKQRQIDDLSHIEVSGEGINLKNLSKLMEAVLALDSEKKRGKLLLMEAVQKAPKVFPPATTILKSLCPKCNAELMKKNLSLDEECQRFCEAVEKKCENLNKA